MSPPVALVTGASSGIGLALTHHLLSKSWFVVRLDMNPPAASLPNTIHIPTDVSSWDAQAAAFETAFKQHSRLDFCALNAGIDDRDDIFASISFDAGKPPRKPDMRTLDVNFTAVYYGVKLAAHYMSLSAAPPSSSSSASPSQFSSSSSHPGGKIVITASSAGLYALPPIPQYTASKHALVGLTRALAPVARKNNISINAIAPAIVATGLAPPGLMDAFGEEVRTPMSTIMRAFDELGGLAEEGVGGEEWVRGGKTGEIVECSLANLFYREEVERADESQKYMSQGALDAWAKAYTERNRNFALRDSV